MILVYNPAAFYVCTSFRLDLPANCNLLQSKTENSQAISHGFNSPSRNLRHKETTINSKGSNKINSSKNSNERIDIVDVFDSRELNPKLDKTNEKNKKLSSHYHLNEEDGKYWLNSNLEFQ